MLPQPISETILCAFGTVFSRPTHGRYQLVTNSARLKELCLPALAGAIHVDGKLDHDRLIPSRRRSGHQQSGFCTEIQAPRSLSCARRHLVKRRAPRHHVWTTFPTLLQRIEGPLPFTAPTASLLLPHLRPHRLFHVLFLLYLKQSVLGPRLFRILTIVLCGSLGRRSIVDFRIIPEQLGGFGSSEDRAVSLVQ